MASDENERGNGVAHAVWRWLQDAKRLDLVPWVSNPKSPDYDQLKVAEQDGRRRLLQELEGVIWEASEGDDDVG